jgi:AcrR family transcriptional regulator
MNIQPQETRTERRSRKTRAKLMRAALQLFRERGVDLTTIAEITERSDLGKGTFYRHFESKSALLLALTEDAVDRLLQHIRGATDGVEGLQSIMARLLDVHVAFFTEHADEFTLLFQSRLFLTTERDEEQALEAPVMRYLDGLAAVIGAAAATPVPSRRLRRLACALAGYVSGFLSFAYVGLSEQELKASFTPLREAFASTATALLADREPVRLAG